MKSKPKPNAGSISPQNWKADPATMRRYYQLKNYLKFLVTSNNQHGVHSPFVYQLITACFYDKKKYPRYKLLQEFRKEIATEDEKIGVSEKIAPEYHGQKKQQIRHFFHHYGISAKKQRLLYRLSSYFELKNALVIHGVFGSEALALSTGNSVKIYTAEKFPEQSKKMLKKAKFSALYPPTFIDLDFGKLPQEKFDLIYLNTYSICNKPIHSS